MTARALHSTTATRLELQGLGGLLDGVRRRLSPGETLVIGRSRSCDVSLRKTKAFQDRADAPELLRSTKFNRVSRIHCEIELRADGDVEIRDLSQNGTFVDGVRVGRSHRLHTGRDRVALELVDGTWGKLLLTAS